MPSARRLGILCALLGALLVPSGARAQLSAVTPELIATAGEDRVLSLVCEEARWQLAAWEAAASEFRSTYEEVMAPALADAGVVHALVATGHPGAEAAVEGVCGAGSVDAALATLPALDASLAVEGESLGASLAELDILVRGGIEERQRALRDEFTRWGQDLRQAWEVAGRARRDEIGAAAYAAAAGATSEAAADAIRAQYEAEGAAAEASMRAQAAEEEAALRAEARAAEDAMRAPYERIEAARQELQQAGLRLQNSKRLADGSGDARDRRDRAPDAGRGVVRPAR